MELAGRFSLLGTETAFAVAAEARRHLEKGSRVFAFHLGDIDLKTPDNIIEATYKAMKDGRTGYCSNYGIIELRDALAADINRSHGTSYTGANVAIQPGGKPVIQKFFLSLMNPGDEVLIPAPGYPIYESMVAFHGGTPVLYPYREGASGFALVLRDRYLLLIGVMLLVLNLVNTTGEYVLSNAVRDHAHHVVPATAHADLAGAARDLAIEADRREVIKAFYADFFSWVNLIGFLIQAFLVSRVIGKLGVRGALFVLPVVAFGAYGAIWLVGGIALIRAAKIAENGTDYSLQNTVRQALFLPTTRAVKYKAKAAIDTFFMRAGDTLSALLVGLGVHQLGLGGRQLALVNAGLVVVWIAISAGIARHHRRLSPDPS